MVHSPGGLLRLIGAGIFAVLIASPALAVVIDFEDINTAGGPIITDRYSGLGVVFNSPRAFDYPTQQGLSNFVHSGTKAIEQCFALEFCQSPVRMTFGSGQARVKCWVGCTFAVSSPIVVLLNGYDGVGNLVASDQVTLQPRSGPTPVSLPLEIGAFGKNIIRAEVTTESGYTGGIVVDDVEFDTIGPPPPCPATNPPAVNIASPSAGATVVTNRFLYQDVTVTEDPNAIRTIAVSQQNVVNQVVTNSAGSQPKMNTWMYGLLTPGLNTITTTISDCKGTASRSTTINYNPLAPGVGVEVIGWEINQSIQDLQNSVPAIAGKRTFLRVYLRISDDSPNTITLPNVSGVLNTFRPGPDPTYQRGPAVEPINLEPLQPITIDNSPGTLPRQGDFKKTLTFELPFSWTRPGRYTYSLKLTVDGIENEVPFTGGDYLNDLSLLQYKTFYSMPAMTVKVVDFPYHNSANTTVFTPRDKDHTRLKSWLLRAYPIDSINFTTTTAGTLPWAPGQGVPTEGSFLKFEAPFINSFLEEMREMDYNNGGLNPLARYYGMVSDGGGFMRGQADSIPSKVASGPSGSDSWGWDTDGSYADWYGGHEIGHCFGKTHVPFCGAEVCPEFISFLCPGGFQPYPYPDGLLSGANHPLAFGLDVGDASQSIKPALYSPAIFHDVMTYCQFEWMSDVTYEHIFNQMSNEWNIARARRTDSAITGVILTGVLDLTHDTGVIMPAWRLDNLQASNRPAESHYHILFKSAAGAVLADYPFDPKVDTEVKTGEDIKATMAEVLPWVDGTRRIVVMRDTVEMAHVDVSPNSPTVLVLSPNGGETLSQATANVTWQASDLDGDALTFSLQYSKDAGATWQTIATRFATTSFTLRTSELPGSATALFKVIASDGVNTGSDVSNAVFTVPGKSPTVSIIAPASDSEFTSSQTIACTGDATDVEDGNMDGPALTWTSSLQGDLGTGRAISARLNPGVHIVTLSARDSGGSSGQSSIVVTVSAVAPVAVPGGSRIVLAGVPTTVDGSASRGVAPLGFHWEIVRQPVGSTAGLSSADQAQASLTPDVLGQYTLQLTVTDSTGVSAIARMTLIATSVPGALRIAGGLQAATPEDAAILNVEPASPSDGRIDMQDVVRLLRQALLSRQGTGSVTRNAANRYGTYGVVIDDPALNGWRDVPLIAGHLINTAFNPHPLGVMFDAALSRWVIYNEDLGAMPDNERFLYAYGPPVKSVTRSNANAPFAWAVRLDDAMLDQNPSAIVLATHKRASATNPSALGVWFDGAHWLAYNEGGQAMANGEIFSYVNAAGSGGRAVHTAANDLGGSGLYLDDPALNDNPNPMVFVQHKGESQYNSAPMAVGYSFVAHKWFASNEDGSPFPMGESVDYWIAHP